ncbi:hypothetical protein SNEBB_005469 [Seison nebaliae]|nr:hypothetical protein SNEBB_005469 [Seison nebaliae]
MEIEEGKKLRKIDESSNSRSSLEFEDDPVELNELNELHKTMKSSDTTLFLSQFANNLKQLRRVNNWITNKSSSSSIKQSQFYHVNTLEKYENDGSDRSEESDDDDNNNNNNNNNEKNEESEDSNQSEDEEQFNEWINEQHEILLNEFADVNVGEKEMMLLWNRHMNNINIIADHQISLSCFSFLLEHINLIIHRGIERNCILHFINLYSFGLLNSIQLFLLINSLQILEQKIISKRIDKNDFLE